jgi:glutamyl-tRNA reductase
LKHFKVIALTHRNLGLDLVGRFHIEPDHQKERLLPAVKAFEMKELMFLSTCNRVEFFFRCSAELDELFVQKLIETLYPSLSTEQVEKATHGARTYVGIEAVRHLFHVASSLDSLVIGEREIITQVRQSYERAQKNGFTGDFIRLAVQKAIETAKQVYTETEIATKPVSVVNLAYRHLLDRELTSAMNVVYVGAGQTIEAIAGNLKKHDFQSVKVFNRTREKAERLAAVLGGEGYSLNDLVEKAGNFDVLITCTGADRSIIDAGTFKQMNISGKKIIVDLAIPNDIDASVLTHFDIDYIAIDDLKAIAKINLKEREKEIFRCESLVETRLEEFEEAFKTRKLELAMQEVPSLMKAIKQRALDKTFSKDLEKLDDESRETVERIIDYLEKKYISIPMKMAKQVMLEQDLKDPIIE